MEQTRLVLLLTLCLLGVAAQRRCDRSTLGYDCAKVLAEYYTVHWTLEEGFMHLALEGVDAEWLGFSFAEEEGEMAPADAVIGWLDVNGPNVRAYRIVTQSVFNEDEDPAVPLTGVSAAENGARTIVAFSRRLRDGRVRIDPEADTLINFAAGDTDSLRYHGVNRGWDTIRLSAEPREERDGPFEPPNFTAIAPAAEFEFAPAPASVMPPSEPPTEQPIEPPDSEPSLISSEAPELEAEAPEDEEQIALMLDDLL